MAFLRNLWGISKLWQFLWTSKEKCLGFQKILYIKTLFLKIFHPILRTANSISVPRFSPFAFNYINTIFTLIISSDIRTYCLLCVISLQLSGGCWNTNTNGLESNKMSGRNAPKSNTGRKGKKIIHFGMTKAKYLRSTLILTQKQMGVAWASELKLNAIKWTYLQLPCKTNQTRQTDICFWCMIADAANREKPKKIYKWGR